MKHCRIKNVPPTETYLFAKKVELKSRSLFRIPVIQKIKFVMTDKALYTKIANVLIDTTGTQRLSIDEIVSIKIKRHLIFKKIYDLSFNRIKASLQLTESDCTNIVNLLLKLKPNIIIEK